MYNEHSLRENPPGNFRPDEVLIDTVGGKLVHGDSALDLSNKAVNSLYLAQEGFYVAAVAPDPELVADTASKADETGANIKVYSSDLTALPFQKENLISCMMTAGLITLVMLKGKNMLKKCGEF